MNNRVEKDGTPLTDLETWFELAGPKSAVQWKDGRSAKECARAWTRADGIPHEIRQAIESEPGFGAILRWQAEPEARCRFDEFAGEPANLDVMLRIEDEHGPAVIAIEAKADEPFGATVAEALRKADGYREKNPRSRARDRIEGLTRRLLGVDRPEEVGELRYQLLTATAAALSEAERTRCRRALVLVHEFVTDQTEDARHMANEQDLQRYVESAGKSLGDHSVAVRFRKVRTILR